MRLSSMLTAVDVHAGGEPGRVIVGGVLDVPGASMFDKRLYLQQHADHLRKRMLREPGMLAVVEPVTEIVLEAPAGLIAVRAEVANGKVKNVTFRNVPAFAVH